MKKMLHMMIPLTIILASMGDLFGSTVLPPFVSESDLMKLDYLMPYFIKDGTAFIILQKNIGRDKTILTGFTNDPKVGGLRMLIHNQMNRLFDSDENPGVFGQTRQALEKGLADAFGVEIKKKDPNSRVISKALFPLVDTEATLQELYRRAKDRNTKTNQEIVIIRIGDIKDDQNGYKALVKRNGESTTEILDINEDLAPALNLFIKQLIKESGPRVILGAPPAPPVQAQEPAKATQTAAEPTVTLPAIPRVLPQGSYTSTCKDCVLDEQGIIITCQCKNKNAEFYETFYNLTDIPENEELANCDGKLMPLAKGQLCPLPQRAR